MQSTEFLVSNDALNSPEELKNRAKRDGYLFFRGLINKDAILAVRRHILELCRKEGWLEKGPDLTEGRAAPGVSYVEPEPAYMRVYDGVMKLESFHTLAHDPAILDVCRKVFGEEPLVHARNIARIIFPQNTKFTTPAHQDYIYIQGTPETYTAWFPLGDCPKELGNLSVMVGSHRAGLFKVKAALGAGGAGIDTESLPYAWAEGDYRLGDFILFHSMTIHRALPNLTPSSIRLSVDYRYQGISQPLVESSMQPHFGRVSWDEIYKGWKSTKLQYYWKDLKLNYVPFDRGVHEEVARERGVNYLEAIERERSSNVDKKR
jgi:ectoine hydroxylase-related dioxygenase (phytanoyl-CoA dioxygenase family)